MIPVPQRLRAYAAPLLLLTLVVALNAPALRGGFSDPDDFLHLDSALGIARGDPAAWNAVLFSSKGVTSMRLVPWLLWGANARVAGVVALGYYLVNLGLHALLAGAVYALARAWGGDRRAALVAGVLVGLSPSSGQAVYYLSGRDDQLANLAVVGALLLWERGRATRWGPWATAGVLLLGLLSKVTAGALLPILLVSERLRPGRRLRGRGLARFLPLLGAVVVYAALLLFSWRRGHATALLGPGQQASLGHVGALLRNVGQAALVPLVSKHGSLGRLPLEVPRLLSYAVLIGALWRAGGPNRRLAGVGAAWLLFALILPYPWLVADGFRAQDSGRYLQLPLIGWALLVASACGGGPSRWQRAAAPTSVLAAVIAFALGVSPGLGRDRAPIEALTHALRAAAAELPPGGRIVLGLSRLDQGVTSLIASPVLDAMVPSLGAHPDVFLEGQTTLWRPASAPYRYARFEAADPTFRLSRLDPSRDRVLVEVAGPEGTVFRPAPFPLTTIPGGAEQVWDFRGGDPQGWQWRSVPRHLYRAPPEAPAARVAPAPAVEGAGLELWSDRFLPPGVLGRLVAEPGERPPHVVSPPLAIDPRSVCALEVVLQLPGGAPSGGRFPVPSGRLLLLSWTGQEDLHDPFEAFLVAPLSAFPGEQRVLVRLDNSPSWLGAGEVRRIALLPSNVPGPVDLRRIRLLPCS